ncbi:hypothetical protein F2Q69_00030171 [Brassica cretica]|uniref:Alcohol dehydrogenase-like N-terminal domain-containing protein n=1 Tax=Brassica cretica TaxID=69181 RepID=A0A8S9S1P2_BRACR|nr:hypothetical protein F2Q69_00030171 [Brassica cretica]
MRIVESVGEGVKDVKEGDYVIPTFNGECGECRVCTNGVSNLCERYKVDPMKRLMVNDGGTRFSTTTNKDGGLSQKQRVYHFLNTSTFTEYTVLDSACVVKIDPNAPLKQMSLLSCGVYTDNPKLPSSSSCPPLPALSPSSLPQLRGQPCSQDLAVSRGVSSGLVELAEGVYIISLVASPRITRSLALSAFFQSQILVCGLENDIASAAIVYQYPLYQAIRYSERYDQGIMMWG